MSQAVLELCTENKDKEKVQLDQALREAEVRPEVLRKPLQYISERLGRF